MMHKPYTVGLVGARGHVGREMMALIEASPDFELVMATSREHDGKMISAVFDMLKSDVIFEALTPDAVAARGCDILVLGLPNGLAAPYVEAIEANAPKTLLLDLSADYRHEPGWVFGLSDLLPHDIKDATRIANPGCYATAAILALYPLKDIISGGVSVFGVSGYSGAGTTPGPKNDPDRLRDNILPYGFSGHGHQTEISKTIGHPVRFMPHVASFFRGLITTVSVSLKPGVSLAEIEQLYQDAYADNPTVHLQEDPPELREVASTPNAIIGGMALDESTNMLALSCVHDNLLKGAASQAMDNLRLALDLSSA
ncbi:MAG: N-acetyl-gamma-glutamyl-phosphate reductase [Pseudomonadota bacterium]